VPRRFQKIVTNEATTRVCPAHCVQGPVVREGGEALRDASAYGRFFWPNGMCPSSVYVYLIWNAPRNRRYCMSLRPPMATNRQRPSLRAVPQVGRQITIARFLTHSACTKPWLLNDDMLGVNGRIACFRYVATALGLGQG